MKLVLFAAMLLAAAGSFAVYKSDVWRTKAGNQISAFSEWTPQNIAKYPDDYLTFCENKVNSALDELKARQVSIAQADASVTTMRDDALAKAAVGQTILGQLKHLYLATSQDNSWPVMWEQQTRDELWTRTNIEQVYKQVQIKKNLRVKCDEALSRLKVQEARLPEVRSQALEQLAQIHANREILKVNRLSDELSKQLVSMKGLVQGIVSTADSTPANINLDELAVPAIPAQSEDFKKILAAN
jgi:hypothetical protein